MQKAEQLQHFPLQIHTFLIGVTEACGISGKRIKPQRTQREHHRDNKAKEMRANAALRAQARISLFFSLWRALRILSVV